MLPKASSNKQESVKEGKFGKFSYGGRTTGLCVAYSMIHRNTLAVSKNQCANQMATDHVGRPRCRIFPWICLEAIYGMGTKTGGGLWVAEKVAYCGGGFATRPTRFFAMWCRGDPHAGSIVAIALWSQVCVLSMRHCRAVGRTTPCPTFGLSMRLCMRFSHAVHGRVANPSPFDYPYGSMVGKMGAKVAHPTPGNPSRCPNCASLQPNTE